MLTERDYEVTYKLGGFGVVRLMIKQQFNLY